MATWGGFWRDSASLQGQTAWAFLFRGGENQLERAGAVCGMRRWGHGGKDQTAHERKSCLGVHLLPGRDVGGLLGLMLCSGPGGRRGA